MMSEEFQGHSKCMLELSLEPTLLGCRHLSLLPVTSPVITWHLRCPQGDFPLKQKGPGTMEREVLPNILIHSFLLSRFWRCPGLPFRCHRLGPSETGKSAGHRIPGHVLLLRLGPHSVFYYSSVQYP